MFVPVHRLVRITGVVVAFGAATTAALEAAPHLVLGPTNAFSLRSGSNNALSFTTLPSARCSIANPGKKPFVFAADADGIAHLNVRPLTTLSAANITLNVQCTNVTATVASALSLSAGARTPLHMPTAAGNSMLRTRLR